MRGAKHLSLFAKRWTAELLQYQPTTTTTQGRRVMQGFDGLKKRTPLPAGSRSSDLEDIENCLGYFSLFIKYNIMNHNNKVIGKYS